MFGGLEQLDRSFLRGYRCQVTGGREDAFTAIHNGDRMETTANGLAETLARFDRTGTPAVCEVQRSSPALGDVQIQGIASDNDYEDLDWTDVLTHADYCLFVLSSTALLSMCERKALRTQLLPWMKDALGIILTNDDLILDEDRVDIDTSLEKFFQGNVPIFRIPAENSGLLLKTVGELSSRAVSRELRRQRTEQILLRAALKETELQIAVLSSGNERLDEAVELLNEKAKALPARQESACRRARMQYTAPMKVDMSEKISSFYRDITEKLRSEINQGQDIQEIQNILPSYIRDQWNALAQRLLNDIQLRANEMQRDLGSYIEKDIRNYIASGVDANLSDYILRLTDRYADASFQADTDGFRFQEVKDTSKLQQYGVIASGVALVLMAHPIVGAAVAIYGTKKLKEEGNARFLDANRHALVTASEEMCREIYDDMVVWTDGVVSSVEASLTSCIEECYQKILDAMIRALGSRKNDQAVYTEQLEALNGLKAKITAKLVSIV